MDRPKHHYTILLKNDGNSFFIIVKCNGCELSDPDRTSIKLYDNIYPQNYLSPRNNIKSTIVSNDFLIITNTEQQILQGLATGYESHTNLWFSCHTPNHIFNDKDLFFFHSQSTLELINFRKLFSNAFHLSFTRWLIERLR